MVQEARTKSAALDREAWLAGIDAARQEEARRLLQLFAEETGWEPRLWASMIGFGRHVYRYDSGHGGESLVVGFALRTGEVAIYGLIGGAESEAIIPRLGPHRAGKGCLYIRRLAAVDESALRALIAAGVAHCAARWPVHPV